MRHIFVLICFLMSFSALAEVKTPSERMMLSMGVNKILQTQRQAYKAEAENQVNVVMSQLDGMLEHLSGDTSNEIKAAMNDMMISLHNSWDVETAQKIYSEQWNKSYTQGEIEELIKKYEDPSAKNELEVVMAASSALNNYTSNSYNMALEESMAKLMPRVQLAIINSKKINIPGRPKSIVDKEKGGRQTSCTDLQIRKKKCYVGWL